MEVFFLVALFLVWLIVVYLIFDFCFWSGKRRRDKERDAVLVWPCRKCKSRKWVSAPIDLSECSDCTYNL